MTCRPCLTTKCTPALPLPREAAAAPSARCEIHCPARSSARSAYEPAAGTCFRPGTWPRFSQGILLSHICCVPMSAPSPPLLFSPTPFLVLHMGCTGPPGTALAGSSHRGIAAALSRDKNSATRDPSARRSAKHESGLTEPAPPAVEFSRARVALAFGEHSCFRALPDSSTQAVSSTVKQSVVPTKSQFFPQAVKARLAIVASLSFIIPLFFPTLPLFPQLSLAFNFRP